MHARLAQEHQIPCLYANFTPLLDLDKVYFGSVTLVPNKVNLAVYIA
jgi:hypothetical protein